MRILFCKFLWCLILYSRCLILSSLSLSGDKTVSSWPHFLSYFQLVTAITNLETKFSGARVCDFYDDAKCDMTLYRGELRERLLY